MCNFLTNYFFFHSPHSLSVCYCFVVRGVVRCIYELWLMELTLTSICLREWKCSMQWFLPQKLNNKPSKWNGRGEKKGMRTDSTMAMKMTKTSTIVECRMNVQSGCGFIFIFISRTSTTDYQTPPRCVLRIYTRTDCAQCTCFTNPLSDHHHPFLSTIVRWRRRRDRESEVHSNIHIRI